MLARGISSNLICLSFVCVLNFVEFGLSLGQLCQKLLSFSLKAADDLTGGLVLVKSMRKFLTSLIEAALQLVDFKHLSVPLLLKELEHPGEGHRVERFWGHSRCHFQLKQVALVEVCPSNGALAGLLQVLRDQTLFENVSKTNGR